MLVAGTQRHGLEHDEQQCQAHGQLRKDVVERDGESEMQPVDGQRIHDFEARLPFFMVARSRRRGY
jgi:hypothetical protein